MGIYSPLFAATLLRGSLVSGIVLGGLALAALPSAALAQPASALPKPFVSRSLDATLMPITPAVRSAFRLSGDERGVLVVSTDKMGVAARAGIMPGDVISRVRGKAINSPAELDATVLYWLKQGNSEFGFSGLRAGRPYDVTAEITLGLFEAIIDLATIGSWVSVPSSAYFNYATYYDTYDTYIVEEYAVYSEEVEELSISEEFTETVTGEYTEYSEEVSETTEEYSEESEEYSEEMEESQEEYEDASDDAADEYGDEGDYEEPEDDGDDDEGDYDEPEEDEGDYGDDE